MSKLLRQILAIFLVASFLFPVSCSDRPRYKEGEVVDLVKTVLTKDSTESLLIREVQTSNGEARYQGNGLWSVKLGNPYIIRPIDYGDYWEFAYRESSGTVVAKNYNAADLMGKLKQRK